MRESRHLRRVRQSWKRNAFEGSGHQPAQFESAMERSEFDLLKAFVNRPHRVLWRDDIAAYRSIDNRAALLRKKIEKDPDRLRDGNDS